MSQMPLDAMISNEIKLKNAELFASMHQSSLFQFDASEPEAWRKTWEYVIDRLDLEQSPPTLKLEKDETRSGEEETFEFDLEDNDPQWFLICRHFGIDDWTLKCLKNRLVEDFYGDNIKLKHPATNQIKDLHDHIQDFLEKYPQGGTHGVKCEMSELFTLEEVE